MNFLPKLNSFLKSAQNPLIVVLGPTASGKTALSLKIAHEIGGEIISTDSRQIYKGLEIGSDVLPLKKRQNIPHHMIGIVEPDQSYSLAEYRDDALKIIAQIRARKHIPMLVGGTGLYISSIIEEYDVPRIPPDKALRERLYKEAAKKGAEALHKRLAKLDPEAAKRIHPNNLRYVIRALEINKKTGKPKTDKKAGLASSTGHGSGQTGPAKSSPFDVFMIGIEYPREELYERINKRVDEQEMRGLIEEVTNLLAHGYDESLPAMTSLGVKEIIPFIRGEQTLEECKEILKKNTRNYAKRQMTWFRRYNRNDDKNGSNRICWIKPEDL